MKIEIKSRWTGKVIFECEAGNIRLAVEAAVEKEINLKCADLKGADLKGAYLTGADLTGADLTRAYLKGADLTRADLTRADLTGADLTRAYLMGADLKGAYLKGADLTGAYLTGAYLKGADLTGADLTGADLTRADLTRADLTGADLKGTIGFDEIPEIKDLDGQILKILKNKKGELDMGSWHGPKGFCGTTHCRAGWAVHLAGEFGRALEWSLGSSAAGALLYARAYPDLPIPNFTASNEEALQDIQARAALAKKK